jgi:hypothetical protein
MSIIHISISRQERVTSSPAGVERAICGSYQPFAKKPVSAKKTGAKAYIWPKLTNLKLSEAGSLLNLRTLVLRLACFLPWESCKVTSS